MEETPSKASGQAVTAESSTIRSYYPSEVLAIFDAALAKQQRPLVSVRGIYRLRGKQPFNGYYYDAVTDDFADQEMTIRLPATLRDTLKDGFPVELSGVLLRKIDTKGFIQVTLSVTRADARDMDTVIPDSPTREHGRETNDPLRGMLFGKIQKGTRSPDAAILKAFASGRKPKVAILYAAGSIANSDFGAGIGPARDAYDIREERCNFNEPQLLVPVIDRLDGSGSDVVCIVRGGGQGLEALENREFLSRVSSMKTPVVCAVGHVEDRITLKAVCDRVCPTPNGLGSWLREIRGEGSGETRPGKTASEDRTDEPTMEQLQERLKAAERQCAALKDEQEKTIKAARERASLLEGEIEVLRKGRADDPEKASPVTDALRRELENARMENTRLRGLIGELEAASARKETGKWKNTLENPVVWVMGIIFVMLAVLIFI